MYVHKTEWWMHFQVGLALSGISSVTARVMHLLDDENLDSPTRFESSNFPCIRSYRTGGEFDLSKPCSCCTLAANQSSYRRWISKTRDNPCVHPDWSINIESSTADTFSSLWTNDSQSLPFIPGEWNKKDSLFRMKQFIIQNPTKNLESHKKISNNAFASFE